MVCMGPFMFENDFIHYGCRKYGRIFKIPLKCMLRPVGFFPPVSFLLDGFRCLFLLVLYF
jgi:hypothetical protein